MMMMMISIVIFLVCFHSHYTEQASIVNNNALNKFDCSYKDGRFGTIDLSKVGLKYGIPAFRHIPKDDYFYSYNPCYPFSEEPSCTNVALCQIIKDGSAYYTLGINAAVTWSVTADGAITLVYSTAERQAMVNLVCWDELDELIVGGEYQHNRYNFTLMSRCACWNGC